MAVADDDEDAVVAVAGGLVGVPVAVLVAVAGGLVAVTVAVLVAVAVAVLVVVAVGDGGGATVGTGALVGIAVGGRGVGVNVGTELQPMIHKVKQLTSTLRHTHRDCRFIFLESNPFLATLLGHHPEIRIAIAMGWSETKVRPAHLTFYEQHPVA